MQKQTFVVTLEEGLARQVMTALTRPGAGYRSLDELVSVALLNQVNVETAGDRATTSNEASRSAAPPHALLRPPTGPPPADLVEAPGATDGLFILTNRVNPLKLATRVLANLHPMVSRLTDRPAGTGPGPRRWATARTLGTVAGQAARALGETLREEDRAAGRTGWRRRWTGYPVGRDERASLDRFAVSFTSTVRSGIPTGPLMALGLAAPTGDGRVALTAAGWRLATARSPLLDGTDDDATSGEGTLSPAERRIVLEQIVASPGERDAVRELLELVAAVDGDQMAVDAALQAAHPTWTENHAAAHRAAIVGRLVELGLLEVDGRGRAARLTPTSEAGPWHARLGPGDRSS